MGVTEPTEPQLTLSRMSDDLDAACGGQRVAAADADEARAALGRCQGELAEARARASGAETSVRVKERVLDSHFKQSAAGALSVVFCVCCSSLPLCSAALLLCCSAALICCFCCCSAAAVLCCTACPLNRCLRASDPA
jgi:hypothetical protein